jgi:hypothetical protein
VFEDSEFLSLNCAYKINSDFNKVDNISQQLLIQSQKL